MDANSVRDAENPINGADLPADPADLFVVLYDLLPDEPFCGEEATDWLRVSTVRRFADRVCTSVLRTGRVTPRLTKAVAKEAELHGDRGVFAALLGLDWALATANPFSPSYDTQTMTWLSIRYLRHHRLNNPRGKTKGVLLPRCTRPGKVMAEGAAKADFFNVHRVTPEDLRRIHIDRIPSRNDPAFAAGEEISIGAVPMLEKYAELEFEWHQRNERRRYRVTPSTGRLNDRVGQVVRGLGRSGADIAVLPESTLSPPLLQQWRTLLGELPDHSRLQWALLGTGPLGDSSPPPNRAVLMDCRTGEIVLRQDKMAGFTVTPRVATTWRLPGEPHEKLAVEDISRGLDITVLESSLGRIAVFVCEDIKQSVQWEAKLQALGVSHILVPLFSSPISRQVTRWDRQAAQRCVEEFGAWVILSNSLAVGAEMRTQPPLDPEDGFNCVVVGPHTREPVEYGDYDTQFCRADNAAAVSRVVHRNDESTGPEGGLPKVQRGWSS